LERVYRIAGRVKLNLGERCAAGIRIETGSVIIVVEAKYLIAECRRIRSVDRRKGTIDVYVP
jgi:hypothetical protein